MTKTITAALIFAFSTNLQAQNYLVESNAYQCILYRIGPDALPIDTLYGCRSCTMVQNRVFSLSYSYPSFNPPPIIELTEWRIDKNGLVKTSGLQHKFSRVLPFNKVNFSLSNGFLLGSYVADDGSEVYCKKQMLFGLNSDGFQQFFRDCLAQINLPPVPRR